MTSERWIALRQIAALAVAAALAGCPRGPPLSEREAAEVVATYTAALADAYRSDDVRVVEPLAGPDHARKLAGLIGAKLDMGLALDAELVSLRVLGTSRDGGAVLVDADERWSYRDRRIGHGEQVGERSEDHYRTRYRLRRGGERWIVDAVEFSAPPEVGRSAFPVSGDVRALHGTTRAR